MYKYKHKTTGEVVVTSNKVTSKNWDLVKEETKTSTPKTGEGKTTGTKAGGAKTGSTKAGGSKKGNTKKEEPKEEAEGQ